MSLFYYFIIIMFIFGIYAFYFYRSAEIPSFYRNLFAFLRCCSTILLIIIIYNPQSLQKNIIVEKKHIAFLIDNSQSMSFDQKHTRVVETCEKLYARLKKDFYIDLFYFGRNSKRISEISNYPQKWDFGTNIYNSIEQTENFLSGQPLNSIILFSDGQHNFSTSASHTIFKTPVHSIGFGREIEQQDIKISSVDMKRTLYADRPAEISVNIEQKGYTGTHTSLVVKRDNTIIHQESVLLDKNKLSIHLQIIPSQTGQFSFSFEIPPRSDELSAVNNSLKIMADVVKEQKKILFLTGAPSFDFQFFRRTLLENSKYIIDFAVNLSNRPLYTYNKNVNIENISEYDMFILMDISSEMFSDVFWRSLYKEIYEKEKNILILAGPNITFSKDNTYYSNLLPFNFNENTKYEITNSSINVTSLGLDHPLLRLNTSYGINEIVWKEMPKIKGMIKNIVPKPSAKILMGEAKEPQMLIMNIANSETIFISFDSFAHLHLFSQAFNANNDSIKKYVSQIIRYLCEKNIQSILSVSFFKSECIVDQNNTIYINAFDKNHIPLAAENILTTIISPSGSIQQENVVEISPGNFKIDHTPKQEGKYTVTVKTTFGNNEISSKSAFFISSFSTEEIEKIETDKNFLKKLSFENNGYYFENDQLDQLIDKIDLSKTTQSIIETKYLWNTWWYFLFIVSLFSLEWYIRKRRGLDE